MAALTMRVGLQWALTKSGCMLENPCILPYPVARQGDNGRGADNQQETELCFLAARRKERRGILRDCTPENRALNSSRPGLESRCHNASSRYLIRLPVLSRHGFKSQSDHQGDLVLGMPKVAKFLVG